MKTLSVGDEDRVEEVKGWLKSGMKAEKARKEMEKLGYSGYHISYILEQATGQKFLPEKPSVLVDTKKIRVGMAIAGLVILAAALLWLFPEAIPW